MTVALDCIAECAKTKEFGFGIEESWRTVQLIAEQCTELDCTKGVLVLREHWERNKAHLMELFGDTGRIVVAPDSTSVYADSTDRMEAARSAITGHIHATLSAHSVAYRYDAMQIATQLLARTTADEIAENKLASRRADPLHSGRILLAGARLGKYVRRYAEQYMRSVNPPLSDSYMMTVVDAVVAAFSMATETLRKSKKLTHVLSVNPLDLLTVSELTNSWTTCHSFRGAHCTGPLAYIMDGVTAVAYAYSATQQAYGLLLPEKVWRQMVYLDIERGSALMSREYPGPRVESAATARRMTAGVLAKYKGVQPVWSIHTIGGTNGYTHVNLGWHYSDTPTVRLRLRGIGEPSAVRSGAESIPCLACGEMRYEGREDNWLCECCGGYESIRCAECGGYLSDENDVFYGPEGEPLCQECLNRTCRICCVCGETIRDSDALQGFLGNWYCDYCYRETHTTCDTCGDSIRRDRGLCDENGGVYCEACFAKREAG